MSKVKSILIGAVVGAAMFMSSYSARAQVVNNVQSCEHFGKAMSHVAKMRDSGVSLSSALGVLDEAVGDLLSRNPDLYNHLYNQTMLVYRDGWKPPYVVQSQYMRSCIDGLMKK